MVEGGFQGGGSRGKVFQAFVDCIDEIRPFSNLKTSLKQSVNRHKNLQGNNNNNYYDNDDDNNNNDINITSFIVS